MGELTNSCKLFCKYLLIEMIKNLSANEIIIVIINYIVGYLKHLK